MITSTRKIIRKLANNKIAVNCKTESEANSFMEFCKENNITWASGIECKIGESKFEEYEKETCYEIEGKYIDKGLLLYYAFLEYYKDNNYQIISCQDLLKEIKGEVE